MGMKTIERCKSGSSNGTPSGACRHVLGAAAIAVSVLAASISVPAAMQLNSDHGDIDFVTAYAEPAPERFGAILREEISPVPEFGLHDEEHELNDAWLGMSVVSEEGVNVGYVIDAYIDEEGLLDELVVMPGDADVLADPIYIPARFAKLGNTAVHLNLTVASLATFEIADDYVMLEE